MKGSRFWSLFVCLEVYYLCKGRVQGSGVFLFVWRFTTLVKDSRFWSHFVCLEVYYLSEGFKVLESFCLSGGLLP